VDDAIAKTEKLKKGLMQELLTKGIGHSVGAFRETPIGKLPEGWEVVRLGEVVVLRNGERPVFTDTGAIPIYGANGIMGRTKSFLLDKDFTIIIGRVGASGEIHLAQGKIWISDNAIYSEDYNRENADMFYLFYFLNFSNLKQFATKSTHPIITQSFLKNYNLPLPPLPEQQKIAEILTTVDNKLELLRKRKQKLVTIKKGLMNDLLTGKKRLKFEEA
jgi:type I restriction enzyme S subunit